MQLARKLLLTTEWIVEAGQKHGEVRNLDGSLLLSLICFFI